MAKKVIKAKNVVRFDDKNATTALPQEAPSALEQVDEAIEQIEEAAARLEEGRAPAEPKPAKKPKAPKRPKAENKVRFSDPDEAEVFETEPLELGKNRYLDETPQDPDWADEEDAFDDDFEEGAESISTFAEVFIPLHTDSTGAIIRKGMVIVSLIVILCCLVALFMRRGALAGCIPADISVWTAEAQHLAAVLRFDL